MLRVNSAGQGIPICFVDIPVNLFTKGNYLLRSGDVTELGSGKTLVSRV